MGRYYARRVDHESKEVAKAIEEHYMPRDAEDYLPSSNVGRVVAIADRIDSLVGLMATGIRVKGDSDPYSLRRMAIAVLRILIECRFDINLVELLKNSASTYTAQNEYLIAQINIELNDDLPQYIFEFMLERLRNYYLNQGYAAEEFTAVVELKPTFPLDFDKR